METQPRFGRRTFLLISGAGLASAYLTSCTVGGTEDTEEQKIRAAFLQPIVTLDPYLSGSTVDEPSLMARRLIFDTLVHRDENGDLAPGLAKSWKRVDDTTWEFELRSDAKFQDGSPVTATDVKAVLDYMVKTPTEQTPLWEPIDEVTTSGKHTVTVKTKQPMGTLPVNLTLLFIASAKAVGKTESFRKPLGSGPYKVTSFTPSSAVRLKRAPEFWGRAGKSTSIELPYISEPAAAITSLTNGEIELLWPIPPDQVTELEGAGEVKVQRTPSWVYYFNWFNCGRKPFTDARVRRAMWHALDIESIVKDLFGAGARPMDAPIPSSVFGYAKQQPYEYDTDKAKKLLREVGLKDGFSTSMMWFDETGPLAKQLASAMISGWRKIGVKVEPQSIEKAEWLERLNSLDWDMDLQTNTVTTGDADFTLGRLYTSTANRLGYKNPKLDTILRGAAESSDEGRRKDLYAQACKIIWDDAPGIFPANIVTAYGRRETVSGFRPAASNQPDLTSVGLSG